MGRSHARAKAITLFPAPDVMSRGREHFVNVSMTAITWLIHTISVSDSYIFLLKLIILLLDGKRSQQEPPIPV